MRHHQCVKWAASGAALGVACVAYGQTADTEVAAALADPTSQLLVELLQGGGLPAVLAVCGWWLGRGGGVPVTLALHAEDRKRIDLVVDHLRDKGAP